MSKINTMDKTDWKKWINNLLVFSSPVLVVFFGMLANGVSVKEAWPVAALVFYQALADLFKKYKSIK